MSPTIQEVKAKHEARLLDMRGVVSVGIGRDAHGTSVIIVGLDSSQPQIVKQLPKEIDGYPVQVQIVGPITAQD